MPKTTANGHFRQLFVRIRRCSPIKFTGLGHQNGRDKHNRMAISVFLRLLLLTHRGVIFVRRLFWPRWRRWEQQIVIAAIVGRQTTAEDGRGIGGGTAEQREHRHHIPRDCSPCFCPIWEGWGTIFRFEDVNIEQGNNGTNSECGNNTHYICSLQKIKIQ